MVQQTLLQSPAFSLTRALLSPGPSPLPKVRDYLHRLLLQSLHSVHLPGKANIMLKSTGCKCSQSSHTADSLPPEEVTPLGKLLPYIKVQSFMQNSAHSACAPSQLAANKPKSEDIKKKKKKLHWEHIPFGWELIHVSWKEQKQAKFVHNSTDLPAFTIHSRLSTTLKHSTAARWTCAHSLPVLQAVGTPTSSDTISGTCYLSSSTMFFCNHFLAPSWLETGKTSAVH